MFCSVLFCSARFGSELLHACCAFQYTHTYGHIDFIVFKHNNLLDTIRLQNESAAGSLIFLRRTRPQSDFCLFLHHHSSLPAASNENLSSCSTVFAIKNLQLDLSVLCAAWLCVKHQQRSFKEESAN